MNPHISGHPLSLFALVATTALASAAPLQGNGPTSSLANGISLSPAAGEDGILIKAPLNQTTPPLVSSAGMFQQTDTYVLADMFPNDYSIIEIDAMSAGACRIPNLVGPGVIGVENSGGWLGLVLSVGEGAMGTPGGVIAAQYSPIRSMSGDLFGYYFAESTGLHNSVSDHAFLEQAKEDMGFPSSGTSNIDAFDYSIGVRSHAQQVNPQLVFEQSSGIYFSLSRGCVNDPALTRPFAIEMVNIGGVPTPVDYDADAATIYQIQRVGNAWSSPQIYAQPWELGLASRETEAHEGDDIDALAIAYNSNVVVFSTVKVPLGAPQGSPPNRPQLLVSNQRGSNFELRGSKAGVTYLVADKLGADDEDEIDAVDVLDPEHSSNYHPTHIAVALHDGIFGSDLQLSVTRSADPITNSPSVHIQTTGWGQSNAEPSTVYIVHVSPSLAFELLEILPRSATEWVTEYRWEPAYSLQSGSHGFMAVMITASTLMAQSTPISMMNF